MSKKSGTDIMSQERNTDFVLMFCLITGTWHINKKSSWLGRLPYTRLAHEGRTWSTDINGKKVYLAFAELPSQGCRLGEKRETGGGMRDKNFSLKYVLQIGQLDLSCEKNKLSDKTDVAKGRSNWDEFPF